MVVSSQESDPEKLWMFHPWRRSRPIFHSFISSRFGLKNLIYPSWFWIVSVFCVLLLFEMNIQDAAACGGVFFFLRAERAKAQQSTSVACVMSLRVHSDSASFPQGTLKDHFRKSDSGFGRILEFLQQSFLVFKKKKTEKYQVRNEEESKNKTFRSH